MGNVVTITIGWSPSNKDNVVISELVNIANSYHFGNHRYKEGRYYRQVLTLFSCSRKLTFNPKEAHEFGDTARLVLQNYGMENVKVHVQTLHNSQRIRI